MEEPSTEEALSSEHLGIINLLCKIKNSITPHMYVLTWDTSLISWVQTYIFWLFFYSTLPGPLFSLSFILFSFTSFSRAQPRNKRSRPSRRSSILSQRSLQQREKTFPQRTDMYPPPDSQRYGVRGYHTK